MKIKDFLNVGSIHDIPIGKGVRFSAGEDKFAVFRETYGHFYVFADENPDSMGSICQGTIDHGKIRLPDGHSVDLHTGQLDQTDHFLRSFIPWVENGFVLFSYNPNRIEQYF